ncbi:MAG: geranylgeranyl reductase family protein [Micromonosporaceae bacterium]
MRRLDAIVVGAGPAGSVAALVLARGGARVALVERRAFPRPKACGDLIGPRGVRLLAELGISVPGAGRLGDMVVIGPSGRKILLPALPGPNYADHALAVPREKFDALLFEAAVAAGAHPVHGRVSGLYHGRQHIDGVRLAGGADIRADVTIGADGATSQVAQDAGLVDSKRVLWGFALRGYADAAVDLPHIALWEPSRWRLFPGYGWVFPVPGGPANVGLGLGLRACRGASRRAGEQLDAFLMHLRRHGLLSPNRAADGLPMARLGGWLKLGMVGTTPAGPGVLLVGDAAGLVNPLQGEGIAQAMASGQAAAHAILAQGPSRAGHQYRRYLRVATQHHRVNAPVHAGMVSHPLAVSAAGRILTAPVIRGAVAGAWALYWNDLASDALPGQPRRLARGFAQIVAAAGSRTASAKWFAQQLGGGECAP